ncbi:MAG: Hpt domain-containing protein [Pseudomonadota bacterium]
MSDSPPVFDSSSLLSNTGGDVELAAEILEIFRNQAELWGRMLDPASPGGEWADAAHSLKGTALSAGALRLAASCARAEAAGRSGESTLTEAAVLLSEVKDDLAEAIEAAAAAAHEIAVSGALKASKDSNS